MDDPQKIKKPMTKDEVALLVSLIHSTPILTSKETNAATNKAKDEAWNSVARAFNAKSGSVPKKKAQLKLKWDNLKKTARKRAQEVRMNHLKTGGGKPDFIPHDEVLEKVTALLGSTCTGFDVPFGGDAIGGGSVEVLDMGFNEEVQVADLDTILEQAPLMTDETNASIPENIVTEIPGMQAKKRKIELWEGNTSSAEGGSKVLFGMPISRELRTKKKGKRKAESDVHSSTVTRNLAIASYYEKKREKLDLEITLLKLEIAQKENNVTANDDKS